MKLKSYNRPKVAAGNKLEVTAKWADQMRRPGRVTVTTEVLEPGTGDDPQPVIQGDAGDVYKTLEGLALIAWDMGWRPPGLVNKIAQTVQDFKP